MSVNGKWADIEEQDLLAMGKAFDVRNAVEVIGADQLTLGLNQKSEVRHW